VSWAPDMDPVVAGSAVITSGVTVLTYADTSFVGLEFNVRSPRVFSDVQVRRALAYAVDHDSVVAHATGAEQAYPVWGDIDTASWAYGDNALTKYGHDVNHAKRLLQSAGWAPGRDGVATRSATRLAPTLIYPANDPARAGAARLIAQQAQQAGFAVAATALASADFAKALSAGTFDAALISAPAGPDPDDAPLLKSKGTANAGGYSNPALDTLIDSEQNATPTQSATLQQVRKPIFDSIEKTITTDLPVYFLWTPRLYNGFSATLAGITSAGADLDAARSNAFYLDWYLTS